MMAWEAGCGNLILEASSPPSSDCGHNLFSGRSLAHFFSAGGEARKLPWAVHSFGGRGFAQAGPAGFFPHRQWVEQSRHDRQTPRREQEQFIGSTFRRWQQ